jgi:hypothetical protein
MEQDIRANLEKLFTTYSGIDDPITRMQFKHDAFSEVERSTGYSLADLLKVHKQEEETKRTQAERKKLENLLRDLTNDLNSGQSLERIYELLLGVRHHPTQVQGDSTDRIMARLGGQHGRFNAYIAKRTGRQTAGVVQDLLPELNEALNGYQGVTMVAGPTNSSKTQFFLHNVVSILNCNPDTAILYLALDQEENKLLSRLGACLNARSVRSLEQGSNVRYSETEPLSDEDCQARAVTDNWMRENLGSRLFLLDRVYFPGLQISWDIVAPMVRKIKEISGLSRVVIMVDYLDLLQVEGQDKMKDIYVDQQRIQALLDWRLLNDDDPILAITEVNKESTKEGEAIQSSGVMGSARKIYSPDNVLIINPFTNTELMEWTDEFMGGDLTTMNVKIRNFPNDIPDGEVRKKAFKKAAQARREWLAARSLALGTITVTKVRDGGKRARVYYTNQFDQSRFSPGLSYGS